VLDAGHDGLWDGHLAGASFVGDAIALFDDAGSDDPPAIF
jgi:hypothetical protein